MRSATATVQPLVVAALLLLCSCASHTPKNEACIVQTQMTPGMEQCLGTLDVVYTYVNPKHPALALGRQVNFRSLSNPWVLQNAQGQDDPNGCYAAALSSAFKALDQQYRQEQFRQAISNECFGQGIFPLTFSQIVFAATRVHVSDRGTWYVDPEGQPLTRFLNNLVAPNPMSQVLSPALMANNGGAAFRKLKVCQSIDGTQSWSTFQANVSLAQLLGIKTNIYLTNGAPPQKYYWAGLEVSEDIYQLLRINLYRGVEWHSSNQPPGRNGGIYPIAHSGHLVHEVAARVPVLAGLTDGPYGHVVLVSGLSFYRGANDSFVGSENDDFTPDASTYVEWVEVVDPADIPGSPYKISGDEFFKQAQFMFSIYQPR